MISMNGRFMLASGFVVVSACSGSGERSAHKPAYLSIATAGTGGIYYPLGGGLANILSSRHADRTYTAEVSGGSVENVNRLRSGQVDLAMAIATTIYEAYHGGTDFAEPRTELRIVAPLYPNLTHVLVRRGARIRTIADLRGMRVSVGAAGSGTEQLARHVLEAYGLSPSDVNMRYLSFNESAAALRDGAIDAAIISVGAPASAVLEATTTGDARLLPIDSTAARRMASKYPYYVGAEIPAGSYRGVTADVPTVAVMNWIIANASLDSSTVNDVLDVLRDEGARLIQVHEIARQIDLSMLRSAPIPLHPAAQRWMDANHR
jgi:TRAP transporter TAXI family solute receptor